MNEPIKKPQPTEKSLGYIAWSLKDIHKELQTLNESLKNISMTLQEIKNYGVGQ